MLVPVIGMLDDHGKKLDLPPAPDSDIQAEYVNREIEPITITVENLSFTYPDGDQPVLKNINLQIPMGTSIAFVGGSGSGKTTLVDLILGLFSTEQGRVLCNGVPIEQDLPAWFQRIGYVPQDVFIADSTVLEAVAFGLEPHEIDEARVRECLAVAELTEVVDSLENGLLTMNGHNAVRLSGGQRQRIAIVTALLRYPRRLVLDEATSALDTATGRQGTELIAQYQCTKVVVAHRLSTVRNAENIVVMEDGRIIQSGRHDDLMMVEGRYRELYSQEEQSSQAGYIWAQWPPTKVSRHGFGLGMFTL